MMRIVFTLDDYTGNKPQHIIHLLLLWFRCPAKNETLYLCSTCLIKKLRSNTTLSRNKMTDMLKSKYQKDKSGPCVMQVLCTHCRHLSKTKFLWIIKRAFNKDYFQTTRITILNIVLREKKLVLKRFSKNSLQKAKMASMKLIQHMMNNHDNASTLSISRHKICSLYIPLHPKEN